MCIPVIISTGFSSVDNVSHLFDLMSHDYDSLRCERVQAGINATHRVALSGRNKREEGRTV